MGLLAPETLARAGVAQFSTIITAAAFTVPNDPSQFFLMNSGSAQVVTLPAGLDQWLPGMILSLTQMGTGTVSVVAASGVTLFLQSGVATLISKGQHAVPQLLNVGKDQWIALAGGLN